LTFILAMVLHPEVQDKAQRELDKVVGNARLPNFEDRAELPFVRAIVLECLRWQPVVNLGLPHVVTEDDVYRGMIIPANTVVWANVWGILHDEENYPAPHEFNPDRFVEPASPGVNQYPSEAFGFGRRICPGRYLAENSIWLAIARILATFTICKAVDEKGMPIEPSVEYAPHNSISRPKPFQCRFVPRSEAAVSLIREAGGD